MAEQVPVEVLCPVCACPVEGEAELCPACETPHHRDCWAFAGGCAIFGCRRTAGAGAPATVARGAVSVVVPASLRWWLPLFKAEWAAFGLMAGGSVALAPVFAFSVLVSLLLQALPVQAFDGDRAVVLVAGLMSCAVVCILGGLLAYLGVAPLAMAAQASMARSLETSLDGHRAPSRELLDRMEVPSVGRFFLAVARWSASLSGWAAVATIATFVGVAAYQVTAYHVWPLPREVLSAALFVVVLGLVRSVLAPIVLFAMERRTAYLSSLQNRMLATLERAKKG